MDALMAPDPARAETARRDPRIGSGGVIALVLVIGAEVAAIVSVIGSDGTAIGAATVVVALTMSRAIPVVAAALLRAPTSERPAGGFGVWFADQVGRRDALVATGLAGVVCGLVAAVVGLPALAVVAVVGGIAGGLVTGAIRAARGGLDGDGLGASIELTTLAVLATMAVVGG
jgi:adenosylcobinamide-GDP ribazoletransferase